MGEGEHGRAAVTCVDMWPIQIRVDFQSCRRMSGSGKPDIEATKPMTDFITPETVQLAVALTRVLLECSILPAGLALEVVRARPPAWRLKCRRAATRSQPPGTRDRN
jgi:hypothetical protein